MFNDAAENIVDQLDPDGSLIPVSVLYDAHKLKLMTLVLKKKRYFVWQRPKYRISLYTLSDLLEGDEPLSADFLDETDLVSYQGKTGKKVGANLGAKAGAASAMLEGQRNKKIQAPVGKLKKEEVDVKKLLRDASNRRVNMQHYLVKQLKKKRKFRRTPILTVLTERIVTRSACTISEFCSFGAKLGLAAKASIPVAVPIPVSVEGKANVQSDRDEALVIPPGTVFAYRVRELDIEKDGYFELCLGDNRGDLDIECDAMVMDDGLVPELESLCPLAELPGSSRSALFQSFCELMKDREAMSDVEDTLDEWFTLTDEAPVETEQDVSVSHSSSARAILDLLRPDPGSRCMKSEGPGSPLTAVHLLVCAMEALPDEALNLLSESSPDVLEAFNALLNMLDLKDEQKSCSSLPLESLAAPLKEDKAFHWAQQLLVTFNVNLRKEAGQLLAEKGSKLPGVLPLCFVVQGLSSLSDQ